MSNEKLAATFNVRLAEWREGLAEAMSVVEERAGSIRP
jgi:hypothetical protein